jgi:twitching motility protein PilT
MLSPLLPDDDLSTLLGESGPNGAAKPAAAPAARPAGTGPVDDAQLLRGLLEDGPLTMSAGSGESGARRLIDESLDGDSTRPFPLAEAHIDDILRLSQQMKSSDIHLTVGLPPMVRVDGRLVQTRYEVVTPREVQRLVYDVLSTDQIEKFERTKELDFSYGVAGIGRFRFNVYRQKGTIGCAMRAIPAKIPSLEQLRLPTILRDLTKKHSGLILVTGPTGSGKSTTIASMIDVINSERPVHIMTMEDPVEYLHVHKTGMINQREIGQDTESFANAIRAVLREDPDVILVGEMRDKETIAAALTLAETGHLVFGTLHTRSAPSTIDRIVDVFPPDQQDQIKVQLANSIQAVVAQQLLPQLGGGRVAALEIMVATSAIRNLIREGKTYQIMSSIETGSQYGMQPMDKILADLHKTGIVSYEEALLRAIDRENFIRLVKGV